MNNSENNNTVKSNIADWQQGDYAIAENLNFMWLASLPDTMLHQPVSGYIVLSQTCDIAKPKLKSVLVSPLSKIQNNETMRQIKKCKNYEYAFVPALEKLSIAANLNQIMTINKSILAELRRESGCRTDEERVAFAQAIARKIERFAFPDDFGDFIKPFKLWVLKEKTSDDAALAAVRSLHEIRVITPKSWNDATIELEFLFIRSGENDGIDSNSCAEYLEKWLSFMPPQGKYKVAEDLSHVDISEAFNLREYYNSVPLDFDQLSHVD